MVNSGSVQSNLGWRVPHHHASSSATGNAFNAGTWFPRHTADGTLTARRHVSGQNWVGGIQSIDTVGVVRPNTGSSDLHVTRSVYDLKDQVLEVWDARGLVDPTWIFSYDYAGRRTVTEHTTGTGTRWALADAADNPIWSRDAKDVEVDRTFDLMNRPLTESSDDGTTVKLRRMWTYVAYDAGDTASKAQNLFGRVEEERDNAGLRFFEYDWRGLVTKVSHRFFDADWTNASWAKYADVDDDATPSGARSGLSYLSLSALTDTTTVEVSTVYDAAGHATEVTYPEDMKLQSTWNEAGLLEAVECDRGLGSGYEDVMTAATYNARGQLTGYTAGNGILHSREYDADTERITRIFTRASGGAGTRFQDQQFAYDPVGNPVLITDALATTSYASNLVIPNTRTFRYDPRYRMIRATGKRHKDATDGIDAPVTPSPSANDYLPYVFRYSYDEVGNFTTNQEYKSGTNNLDYKSGAPDLFDGYGAESYSYDGNGCCTATPRHSALGYSFDSQPVYADMGGGTKVRYRRHADQRATRFLTKTGVKAMGIYLGPWEYHERTGTLAYKKAVLHCEGQGRLAQAEVVLDGSDPDSLAFYFVHGDHLRSTQALTKSDGTMLAQEEFFPYGRSSDRRDARDRYRYIGVERDEQSALCMTGSRAFDPVSGRFLQADPMANTFTRVQPFAYALCAPIGQRDRNGADWFTDGIAGLEFAAGAAHQYISHQFWGLPDVVLDQYSSPAYDSGRRLGDVAAATTGALEIGGGGALAAEGVVLAGEGAVAGSVVPAAVGSAGGPPGTAVGAAGGALAGAVPGLVVTGVGTGLVGHGLGVVYSATTRGQRGGGQAGAGGRPPPETGSVLSSGRKVTTHGAERMKERGFSDENVESIIGNNKKGRTSSVDEEGRKTWEYTDARGNTVVTNEAGDVVTVFSPADGGAYIPKPPRPP